LNGILVDTYAWIEIFQGSLWGEKALECMEQGAPLAVSVLTLYELQYRLSALYGDGKTAGLLKTILSHAGAIPVDMQIALAAGTIKSLQKKKGSAMGAVDCMILATARSRGLKILSGDKHFEGLEETLDITGT
jgi:predicted nucleic acid-binding protein